MTLGNITRVFHWGPLVALTVVLTIFTVTLNCNFMWWPLSSPGGWINFFVFLTWAFLTLYNYFNALLYGPGFIPYNWTPDNPVHTDYLQFCELCRCYKAPRSHHCRKCNRCVMKMDHHCPWINTCCGHKNHGFFTLFLFWAPVGCIHATIILIASLVRAVNKTFYLHYGTGNEPIVSLGILGFISTMFSVGLAIGVILAVGMLFCIQFKSIVKNESGIETWIVDKAKDRDLEEDEEELIFPYYLGWWANIRQVLTLSGVPPSDGYWWPVRPGCDQFTLTKEQLKQKALKRDRTIPYTVIANYSGSLLPVTKGCRVLCSIPCTDEPRISLRKGDEVMVTRWRKQWLYGDKQIEPIVDKEKGPKRLRGWFPRRCAAELYRNGEVVKDTAGVESEKKAK